MESAKTRHHQELIKFVHLLRFGQSGSQSPRRVFLRIKDIAKTVKASIQQVRVLLK
jgi:hypothetical protein